MLIMIVKTPKILHVYTIIVIVSIGIIIQYNLININIIFVCLVIKIILLAFNDNCNNKACIISTIILIV